jgi:hypothetical protein
MCTSTAALCECGYLMATVADIQLTVSHTAQLVIRLIGASAGTCNLTPATAPHQWLPYPAIDIYIPTLIHVTAINAGQQAITQLGSKLLVLYFC